MRIADMLQEHSSSLVRLIFCIARTQRAWRQPIPPLSGSEDCQRVQNPSRELHHPTRDSSEALCLLRPATAPPYLPYRRLTEFNRLFVHIILLSEHLQPLLRSRQNRRQVRILKTTPMKRRPAHHVYHEVVLHQQVQRRLLADLLLLERLQD